VLWFYDCVSDQLTSVYLFVKYLYLSNVYFPRLLSGLMGWCFYSTLDADSSVEVLKMILKVMFFQPTESEPESCLPFM